MKRLTLLLLCAMITGLSYSQEPLTYEDMNTSIGTEFKVNSLISSFAGSPGMDQVWDFSNLFPEQIQNCVTFQYGNTGAESTFPDANFVYAFNFETVFQFFTLDEDEFTFHGIYEEGGQIFNYNDPITYIDFPAEFGNQVADPYEFSYNVNGVVGEVVGTYVAEIDGTGTLQLPWGDIPNVIRVSGVQSHTETFTTNDQTYEATYEGVLTSFFAPGYPGFLLNVSSGTVSIPELNIETFQQQTQYLSDFEFLGVDDVEIVEDLNVFPNPSNGAFTLTFENRDQRDISLEVLDIQGRVVYAEASIGSGFGSVRHEFDLSGLRPGFYLLRLSDGDRFQGRKIQVVR